MQKSFKFDLAQISVYRGELMGVAAIAIILCHAPANIPQIPLVLGRVLSALGMFGNPTFFFLSGVGLYYSLTSSTKSISRWYIKRFVRLLLPYLCICSLIQLIYVAIGKVTIYEAIQFLTGITYWKYGNGAWFVWALIPMYISAPILKRFFDSCNCSWKFIPLVLSSLLMLSVRLLDDSIWGVMESIKQVCSNFPAFIFGMYSGWYIMKERSVNLLWLLLIHVVAFVLRLELNLSLISMVCFTICPSVVLGCYVVKYLKKMKPVFKWFGSISLESYLFNVSLPGILRSIPCICTSCYAPLRYLLVVLIGVVLAKPMHNLSKKIECSFQFLK